MKIKYRKQVTLIVIAAIIFLVIIFSLLFREKDEKVTIGLVLTGKTSEIGWNNLHYSGLSEACNDFDVNLIIKENISENTGECKSAVTELVDEGASMIILSSYNYSNELEDMFDKFSEIQFYAIAGNSDAENCVTYFGRLYQARYLSGIIAGSVTETNKIGYVAKEPNNEINRGINAFMLGVKSVNPEAEVIVKWCGSWDDEKSEANAVDTLISECNIDVVTHHQNQEYVIKAAEEAGIYSIGNNGVSGNYSEKYLTSVVWNWQELYEIIIREFIHNSSDKNNNHWFGIETGAVELSEISSVVDEDVKEKVTLSKENIISGKDVFSGIIYDNQGNLRCEEDETISDETLLNKMDWFVEGVEIYE